MKHLLLIACITLFGFHSLSAQWVKTEGPYGGNVWCFAQSGDRLYAGTATTGIFVSTDAGESWVHIGGYSSIRALGAQRSNVYAGTQYGMHVSTDNGATWELRNLGESVNALMLHDSTLFVGTSSGMRTTTNGGLTWDYPNSALTSVSIFAAMGETLFAGTFGQGIVRSTDNGQEWEELTGAPYLVNSLTAYGSDLYACTDEGVYVSTDRGSSWSPINNGVMTDVTLVWNLTKVGTHLLAATDTNGILVSTDNGASWSNSDFTAVGASTFILVNDKLLTGSIYGVWASVDSGLTWSESNSGMQGVSGHAFALQGNDLFAATAYDIYRTSDNGRTWAPLTRVGGANLSYFNALMFHGPYLFAADAGNGVFRSSDHGGTWEHASEGLSTNKVWSLGQMGEAIFAGAWQYPAHRSTDNGTTWEHTDNGIFGPGGSAFASIGGNLFAATGSGNGQGGVFLSTDTGITWSQVLMGNVFSIVTTGEKLFAGTYGAGIFVSSDAGETWTECNNEQLASTYIDMLYAFEGNLLAMTSSSQPKIYFSNDDGENWVDVSEGLPTWSHYSHSLIKSGGEILLGNDCGFWRRPLSELVKLAVGSDAAEGSTIKVASNPAYGMLELTGIPDKTYYIAVFDLLGMKVMEVKDPASSQVTLDMRHLPSGSYIVRITGLGFAESKVIVKL